MCSNCLNTQQFPSSSTGNSNSGVMPKVSVNAKTNRTNPALGPETLPDGIPPKNNPKAPQ